MKLRFEVNQAEALRRGIDCPKSIVTVEVEPSKLTEKQRTLLADRMDGIDIMKLEWSPWDYVAGVQHRKADSKQKPSVYRVIANLPTFESLMEAVEVDEKAINAWPVIREPQGSSDRALKIVHDARRDNPKVSIADALKAAR